MAANLPQELIYDILLLSPVKSLLRFQCVSKSFYIIIESKDFINSHVRTSFEKRNHRKFINNIANRSEIRKLDINDGSVEEFLLDFDMPFIITTMDAAHCNGLLLISRFQCSDTPDRFLFYKLSILNPSTRHYRKLPDFPENLGSLPYSSLMNRRLSFGYDPTSDDYKVVLIISENDGKNQVWVLELRSSCNWRRIEDIPYNIGLGDFSFDKNCCFVDGFVNFLCCEDNGYESLSQSIVAFDIVKETFSTVPLPNYDETRRVSSYLDAFEGCLSYGLRTEHNFDLYVRKKKDGDEFSWTKLLSFAREKINDARYIGIFGYSKERDKIVLSCGMKNIMYAYDVKKESLQEIKNMKNSTDEWCSVLCIESLVSVRNFFI